MMMTTAVIIISGIFFLLKTDKIKLGGNSAEAIVSIITYYLCKISIG